MLLYLIWATRPTADNPEFQTRQAYDSPEAIAACAKSLACFGDRWNDAMPYYKIFQFLHQKILWNTDSSSAALERDFPSLVEAESYLEQLKKRYLYRAILGMIEDMMYGAVVRYEASLDNFVTGLL